LRGLLSLGRPAAVAIRFRRIARTSLGSHPPPGLGGDAIPCRFLVPRGLLSWWRGEDYSGLPVLRPPGRPAAVAIRSRRIARTSLGSHPPPGHGGDHTLPVSGSARPSVLVEGGGLLRTSCPSPSGPACGRCDSLPANRSNLCRFSSSPRPWRRCHILQILGFRATFCPGGGGRITPDFLSFALRAGLRPWPVGPPPQH
jgi:hypothetical protein